MTHKTQGGVFAANSKRIIGLDVFRIALAVLVYMFHSWLNFGCSYSYFTDFVSVGAIAMTGFFMLSGYSLRLVYYDQTIMEKPNLLRFYIKRMLGIFPLYYFVALVYMLFLGKESIADNLFLLPIEALGLQSTFFSLFGVSHNAGTWFISCIILAYLIFPFLLAISTQLTTKHKIILMGIFMFLDVYAVFIHNKFGTTWTYDNPFYRVLEFVCGLILADINIENDNRLLRALRSRWILYLSIFALLVGVSIMRHFFKFDDYMAYNIIVLPCCAAVLISLGHNQVDIFENSKIISYCGKISYAFYLSQFFAWRAGTWFIDMIGYNHNLIRILFTFIFCIIVSIFLYEIIQKKCIQLIKLLTKNI